MARWLVPLLAFVSLIPTTSWAQNFLPGPSTYYMGSTMLSVPYGVRSLAMGWSGTADDADPANVYFNPANIASVNGATLGQSYVDYLSTTEFWSGGVAAGYALDLASNSTLRFGGSARYNRLNVDIPPSADFERISYSSDEYYLGLALGVMLQTRYVDVAVGAAAKPLTMALDFIDDRVWAFDFGARLDAKLVSSSGGKAVLSIGASTLNRGNNITISAPLDITGILPRTAKRYVGRSVSLLTATVTADGVDETESSEERQTLAGLELGMVDTIFLRIGDSDTGSTYGGGLAWEIGSLRMMVDYARFPDLLDESHTSAIAASAIWIY